MRPSRPTNTTTEFIILTPQMHPTIDLYNHIWKHTFFNNLQKICLESEPIRFYKIQRHGAGASKIRTGSATLVHNTGTKYYKYRMVKFKWEDFFKTISHLSGEEE